MDRTQQHAAAQNPTLPEWHLLLTVQLPDRTTAMLDTLMVPKPGESFTRQGAYTTAMLAISVNEGVRPRNLHVLHFSMERNDLLTGGAQ
jgi:hypothetical protein